MGILLVLDNFKITYHLIEKGADVNVENEQHETALHIAVKNGMYLNKIYELV